MFFWWLLIQRHRFLLQHGAIQCRPLLPHGNSCIISKMSKAQSHMCGLISEKHIRISFEWSTHSTQTARPGLRLRRAVAGMRSADMDREAERRRWEEDSWREMDDEQRAQARRDERVEVGLSHYV